MANGCAGDESHVPPLKEVKEEAQQKPVLRGHNLLFCEKSKNQKRQRTLLSKNAKNCEFEPCPRRRRALVVIARISNRGLPSCVALTVAT